MSKEAESVMMENLREAKSLIQAAYLKAVDCRNQAGDEDALALWNGRVAWLEQHVEDLSQFENWCV